MIRLNVSRDTSCPTLYLAHMSQYGDVLRDTISLPEVNVFLYHVHCDNTVPPVQTSIHYYGGKDLLFWSSERYLRNTYFLMKGSCELMLKNFNHMNGDIIINFIMMIVDK